MRQFLPGLLALTWCASAFAADDPAQENRFITNARQLIFEGRRSGEGYFSPDGNKLIFQSEREAGNPFYQMYVLDLRTGDTTRVSTGTGKTTCGFFQPGTDRVIFASTHGDSEAAAKQKSGTGISRDRQTAPLFVGLRRHFRNLLRQTGRHRSGEPHAFSRLRCRGLLLTGRKANRLLLAARRRFRSRNFRPNSAANTKRIARGSVTFT